jgi:hypothetical protein
MRSIHLAAAAIVAAAAAPSILQGQQKAPSAEECAKAKSATADHATMDHAAHSALLASCPGAVPTMPGQAAFGAISEVVRMLKADPRTDWSRVNVEALRRHLIDMDDVTMHAVVAQRNVAGGLEMEVTGTGNTAAAIKRMAVNHSKMLDQGTEYHVVAREIANGAVITVTSRDGSDARMVAQIRGLGFAGLMTEGDHHAAHHIALARGDTSPHGR